MILTTLPTLISTDRLCNIIKYSVRASQLQGAFCEFGIYQGGSLELIAKFNPNVNIFGIDSFQGLPEPTQHDFHHEGEFANVDYTAIVGYFKMIHPTVRILRGFSPKVFEFFDENIRFAFVHIDVDMYGSVKDACDFFYPRMVENGIMLFDDYGFTSTRGARIAVDEFVSVIEPKFKGELTDQDGLSNKQYIIIK